MKFVFPVVRRGCWELARITTEKNVVLGEEFFVFSTSCITEGICAGRETKTKQKGEKYGYNQY